VCLICIPKVPIHKRESKVKPWIVWVKFVQLHICQCCTVLGRYIRTQGRGSLFCLLLQFLGHKTCNLIHTLTRKLLFLYYFFCEGLWGVVKIYMIC